MICEALRKFKNSISMLASNYAAKAGAAWPRSPWSCVFNRAASTCPRDVACGVTVCGKWASKLKRRSALEGARPKSCCWGRRLWGRARYGVSPAERAIRATDCSAAHSYQVERQSLVAEPSSARAMRRWIAAITRYMPPCTWADTCWLAARAVDAIAAEFLAQ